MVEVAALTVVLATGLFFIALGGSALVAAPRARTFLLGFAGSPAKHYSELAIRLLVGGAFVLSSSLLPLAAGFRLFGWVVLGTTAVLLLLPWRWHHRFACHAVPQALRFLPLLGACSLALGVVVLWAVLHGSAA